MVGKLCSCGIALCGRGGHFCISGPLSSWCLRTCNPTRQVWNLGYHSFLSPCFSRYTLVTSLKGRMNSRVCLANTKAGIWTWASWFIAIHANYYNMEAKQDRNFGNDTQLITLSNRWFKAYAFLNWTQWDF